MSQYRVVIIDDEPWTREVIKELGEWDKMGLQVVGEASDGEYGLEMIRRMKPDIIITDVKMPHLNGICLIEEVRKDRGNTPVIFISGYDDYSFIRSALQLDAVDYLLKPVKPEELNQQLERCIERLSKQQERNQSDVAESGFLDTSWAAKYYTLLDDLADSFNAQDIRVLQLKFREIHQYIVKNESEQPSKEVIVCIYYTLMNTLEHMLLSRDYIPKELFGNTTYVFSRDCSFHEMMDYVQELYCRAYEKMQDINRNRNRLDITKIKKYMDDHYSEGITLELTASIFYVSKEYLSKAFKTAAGKGFQEYLTSLRMERARELIMDYKIPLKEVGELVGYMDQAHFYKAFKRYYGKTPGEIRGLIIDNK